MITYTEENVFDKRLLASADVFIHMANCFNTMGSGVALGVKQLMPELYEADKGTIKGDENKAGTFSSALVTSYTHSPFTGYNLYGQYNYSRDVIVANYRLIEQSLLAISKDIGDKSVTIVMPKIGSGLAGGDWAQIETMISQILHRHKVIISTYKPNT